MRKKSTSLSVPTQPLPIHHEESRAAFEIVYALDAALDAPDIADKVLAVAQMLDARHSPNRAEALRIAAHGLKANQRDRKALGIVENVRAAYKESAEMLSSSYAGTEPPPPQPQFTRYHEVFVDNTKNPGSVYMGMSR